ncbi:choline transporter [Zobellella endophytica]|uniref:Choline transporter n=1 Tax=Zobellella endophytica TaxID=2116700 RepID=A0A2P7QQV0_9GAMM|nr:BCCT family transporter [Zobellella endophytica]PSJ40345.1 choline transporter [Zobellella endophytica]
MIRSQNIDFSLFIPAVLLILLASLPLIIAPEAGAVVVNALLGWFTGKFGWLYLLSGIGSFFFMLWLAYSRFGRIKLGAPEDQPEFSNVSWVAMLFSAGIGISIVNWAFVEPLYFMMTPPLGLEPGSTEAVEWAAMYPWHHWGVVPWALYLVPALPIGYVLYVRKGSVLRLSEACRGLLGNKVDGLIGKIIDVVVILSIVGGVGTSLGLSVPLGTQLLGAQFGLEDTFFMQMIVLALWTALFSWSVYKGLKGGIKILSNVNIILAFILLIFVLFAGPTVFLLDLSTNSFGLMLDNFFHINFWTDPIAASNFPQDWTIFYWAWWIAYCPMMGLFVARISRGRTIKNIILNGVLWGSAGCWSFFAIWGGYAIHLEQQEILAVTQILSEQGIPATVLAILQTMPMKELVLPVFILLSFVFLATTVDSSAYILAAICSRTLTGYEEPTRTNRLMWAFLLAVVGVGLLSVGGLKAAQISTVLVALPMIPVLVIMAMSLIRWIRTDYPEQIAPRIFARDPVTGNVVKQIETSCLTPRNKQETASPTAIQQIVAGSDGR